MATVEDFKSDMALLVETGLMAIKQGDEESAKKLFNAIAVIDPSSAMKKMGYGLIAMHKMDLKNAISLFTEVLAQEPNNYRAQAFLGFSYLLFTFETAPGNNEKMEALKKGMQLANNVIENCDNPTTVQLAQSLIDWEKELQTKVPPRR